MVVSGLYEVSSCKTGPNMRHFLCKCKYTTGFILVYTANTQTKPQINTAIRSRMKVHIYLYQPIKIILQGSTEYEII